jgi:hypothetical protein
MGLGDTVLHITTHITNNPERLKKIFYDLNDRLDNYIP